MSKEEFKQSWSSQSELSFEIKGTLNRKFCLETEISEHLKRNNIFFVATRPSSVPGGLRKFHRTHAHLV